MRKIIIRRSLSVSAFIFLLLCNTSIAQDQGADIDSITLVKKGDLARSLFNPMETSLDSNILILQNAMSFFDQANNIEKKIACYNDLTGAYYYAGELMMAEKMNLIALNIIRDQNLSKDSAFYADALFNQVTIKDVKGFDAEAVELYQEMIELDKKLNTPLAFVVYNYQNMGTAYIDIGEYEEATQALNNAARIRASLTFDNKQEEISNQAELGGIYSDLGECYKSKGEYSEAIRMLEKSLIMLPGFSGEWAYTDRVRYNCYYKLAEIYLELGKKQLAESFANKAIKIKNRSEEYVFGRSYSYRILAKIKLAEGEQKATIKYYDKAIEAATNESEAFSNFPQIAQAYIDKGNALLQFSDYNGALNAFQKGLKIVAIDFNETASNKNPAIENIIQKLSALDLIKGKAKAFTLMYKKDDSTEDNLKKAYKHFLLASKLIQSIRKDFITNDSKHILAEKANKIYEQAIEVCDLLFQKTNEQTYLAQAFLFAESNKAITLLEAINESTALSLSGLPDTLLVLERSLSLSLSYTEKKIAELKAQKENSNYSTQIDKYEGERVNIKEQYRVLINQIENEYPKYYNFKYATEPTTVEKIQKTLLDKETALIEYFVGEDFIYSFLITQNRIQLERQELLPEIFNKVGTLTQELHSAPESESFISRYQLFSESARDLYLLLIEKQLSKLNKDIENLFIIPDNFICFIPFEVLLTQNANPANANFGPSNLSYLLEEYNISYNYSSTLFFNKKQRTTPYEELTILSYAPSFNDAELLVERNCLEEEMYSLKCSGQEVNKINELFKGTVFEEKEATKESFLQNIEDYSVVHLATHACVNELDPMLHQIHFSNGFITPFDLYNLNLNTKMVVLSACNTGTGQMIKGEGVLSLSRSFIQAGANSTLMSLWSVDDCATSDVMVWYYEFLKNGLEKPEALRKTKQTYLNNASDKLKAHPFYWAAFVQAGDVEPLVTNRKSYWSILVFGLIILAASILFKMKNTKNRVAK